jgi:hypothetical protein
MNNVAQNRRPIMAITRIMVAKRFGSRAVATVKTPKFFTKGRGFSDTLIRKCGCKDHELTFQLETPLNARLGPFSGVDSLVVRNLIPQNAAYGREDVDFLPGEWFLRFESFKARRRYTPRLVAAGKYIRQHGEFEAEELHLQSLEEVITMPKFRWCEYVGRVLKASIVRFTEELLMPCNNRDGNIGSVRVEPQTFERPKITPGSKQVFFLKSPRFPQKVDMAELDLTLAIQHPSIEIVWEG